MALTQVRAKLGEEWVVLTYNEATGRYEAELTAPGTSHHQPGDYYPITVEITNDSGGTATATAETMPTLRLEVNETTAPVLTLISPGPGYLQTGTPSFIFEATDEAGGSGVDPESFSVGADDPAARFLDNRVASDGRRARVVAPYTVEAIQGGYRFTWTPPGGWADGVHTVTTSVKDYDGNAATVSGAYTVDTVPPALYIQKPCQRHVVDAEAVTVAGEVWDATSAPVAVTVAGETVPVTGGRFSVDVPLSVGENTISITATDQAGNQTTAGVYMIRLVTDRTQADVDRLAELYDRLAAGGAWTEEELEWYNTAACLRGSYDVEDLNRVGTAVQFLAGELKKRGYVLDVQPKTDWTEEDAPTRSQMGDYLQNVETVRTAQGLYVLEIPYTMRFPTLAGTNAIEKALVETDAYFPNYSAWSAGEISCGE